MNLFDLIGDDVKIHVDMIALPPFHKVWTYFNDKNHADRFLRYVILNNYPLSNYVETYTADDRRVILQKELLEGLEYTQELLDETEKAFIELHDTLKEKLLRQLRGILEDFLGEIAVGKIGLDEAVTLGPKVEKLIQSINNLERDIKFEIMSKRTKGGYKIGMLERKTGW